MCGEQVAGCGPPHLDDRLDPGDDAVHQALELGAVIEVVRVADAHVDDIGGQTGDHVDHHAPGLQV